MAPATLWYPELAGTPASIWEPGGSEEGGGDVCSLAPFAGLSDISPSSYLHDTFSGEDGTPLGGTTPAGAQVAGSWECGPSADVIEFYGGAVRRAGGDYYPWPQTAYASCNVTPWTKYSEMAAVWQFAFAIFDARSVGLILTLGSNSAIVQCIVEPSVVPGAFQLSILHQGDGIQESFIYPVAPSVCAWHTVYVACTDVWSVSLDGGAEFVLTHENPLLLPPIDLYNTAVHVELAPGIRIAELAFDLYNTGG